MQNQKKIDSLKIETKKASREAVQKQTKEES